MYWQVTNPRIQTSVNSEVPDYTAFLKSDLKGITIGVAKEYFIEGIDPEVEKAVKGGIASFARAWEQRLLIFLFLILNTPCRSIT